MEKPLRRAFNSSHVSQLELSSPARSAASHRQSACPEPRAAAPSLPNVASGQASSHTIGGLGTPGPPPRRPKKP